MTTTGHSGQPAPKAPAPSVDAQNGHGGQLAASFADPEAYARARKSVVYEIGEIRACGRRGAKAFWRLGGYLREMKEAAGHGNWGKACDEIGIPERTASRAIKFREDVPTEDDCQIGDSVSAVLRALPQPVKSAKLADLKELPDSEEDARTIVGSCEDVPPESEADPAPPADDSQKPAEGGSSASTGQEPADSSDDDDDDKPAQPAVNTSGNGDPSNEEVIFELRRELGNHKQWLREAKEENELLREQVKSLKEADKRSQLIIDRMTSKIGTDQDDRTKKYTVARDIRDEVGDMAIEKVREELGQIDG